MKKHKISKISENTVRIFYPCGATQDFYCPIDGHGYVRTEDGGQVCRGLASRGQTLEAGPDSLLSVIRTEHGRLMRRIRREYC